MAEADVEQRESSPGELEQQTVNREPESQRSVSGYEIEMQYAKFSQTLPKNSGPGLFMPITESK